MASAGSNLNASQFYVTLADELDSLDEKHTVFGQVRMHACVLYWYGMHALHGCS